MTQKSPNLRLSISTDAISCKRHWQASTVLSNDTLHLWTRWKKHALHGAGNRKLRACILEWQSIEHWLAMVPRQATANCHLLLIIETLTNMRRQTLYWLNHRRSPWNGWSALTHGPIIWKVIYCIFLKFTSSLKNMDTLHNVSLHHGPPVIIYHNSQSL